ncbi:M23 family metallopeptidase [Pseudomonas lopnurensis]|uniref:M23 family metallopeptidase n=1 Tax=Pseudomonas lopnurensis TaxID=1477517 RepID=UPI0018795D12|nr:M23 family metallopeptidase [Pseudomonas lopnurensis]MBE7377103.1 M23 family metallopeptidase [Pseudomonas lopnurensis]
MLSLRPLVYPLLLLLGLAPASSALANGNQPNATGKPGSVRLFINRAGSGKAMDVSNTLDVPVNVTLRLTRMVNVAGVGKGMIRQTVPANSRVRVATLSKRQPGGPIMFKHSFSYALIFSPEPDQPGSVTGPAYALPWQGGPFRISQGAGGDFSHNSPSGRYAVDIAMPVGTPIMAARAGTVVKIRNGQGGRLPDPAGNYVRIAHEDGTHSAYLHLRRGSVQVRPGQPVKAGTLLGQSGNTGRSTGPHLHFVVQKPYGKAMVSIPFRFTQPVESLPNFALNGK